MPTISPKLEKWLENYNGIMNDLVESGFTPTPANARNGLAELTRMLVTENPNISWIRDSHVNAHHLCVPVRIYHPAPASELPVLIYYHGGGHMAGSISVYDPICRKIAVATRHIIVSVDYRLAPEHPYSAGVEDGYAVAEQVWSTFDRHGLNYRKRLSIGGDSAGGALCATIAHRAQYAPAINIRHQILIYPSLDYTMSLPSISRYGTGFLLEQERIQWYFDQYFQHNEDRKKASPLYMEITSRLPRTLVITAGLCPLRDEGAAYTEKLQARNISCRHLHFEDMIHAFLNMEDLVTDACNEVYVAMDQFLTY